MFHAQCSSTQPYAWWCLYTNKACTHARYGFLHYCSGCCCHGFNITTIHSTAQLPVTTHTFRCSRIRSAGCFNLPKAYFCERHHHKSVRTHRHLQTPPDSANNESTETSSFGLAFPSTSPNLSVTFRFTLLSLAPSHSQFHLYLIASYY